MVPPAPRCWDSLCCNLPFQLSGSRAQWTIADTEPRVEAPIAGSQNVSRAGPMLLVLPLHGRALRPIGRALDPWKLVRRMLPDTARDPMRRPAASSGPTYDRPGQPSGPLRVRGLTGEANDQAWFSPFAGSRSLLRAGTWLRFFSHESVAIATCLK